jgi:hypothetical protein
MDSVFVLGGDDSPHGMAVVGEESWSLAIVGPG